MQEEGTQDQLLSQLAVPRSEGWGKHITYKVTASSWFVNGKVDNFRVTLFVLC